MPGTRLFSRMALNSPTVHPAVSFRCRIVANPFGQIRGQPDQDWKCRSVSVVDPLTWLPLSWAVGTHHLLVARGPRGRDVGPDSRRLENVNIEALFSLIMMAGSTHLAAGLGLEAMCLSFKIYDICMYIIYNIQYKRTRVVWMLCFPDKIACSVGYLMPNSYG